MVLQKTNYSESSLIIKLLTADQGIKSFIFKGGRTPKKKGNIISPLAMVSIEYYGRSESDLQNISDVELAHVFKTIPFDPRKTAILFFMNEVLLNAVHDQEDSAEVYSFVLDALKHLDKAEHVANFPVKFLVDLMRHLGLFPNVVKLDGYFDLKESTYVSSVPTHPMHMPKDRSLLVLEISGMKFDEISQVTIDLDNRRQLIHELLAYYHIVLDKWKDIRSLAVLEAALHA